MSFVVTFVDYDQTVLSTQTVNDASEIVAPPEPEREGYVFNAWNPSSWSSLTTDTTIRATYRIISTVTFYDWDGTVISTQTVTRASEIVNPDPPTREGYTFYKWQYASSGANISMTAVYSKDTITVTFVDWDGTVLKTQTVTYRDRISAPTTPTREGYTFSAWNPASSTWTSLLDDTTITATYTKDPFTVTFVDYDETTVLSTQSVSDASQIVAPADPEREGYVFHGWNPSDWSGISEATTIIATYVKLLTVTFVDYDGSVLSKQTVNDASEIVAPADPSRSGYTFYDWSPSDWSELTGDTTIKAVYAGGGYCVVKWLGKDGTVLKREYVVKRKSATPPEVPEISGYTFTGWDNGYSCITENISITAVYEECSGTFTVIWYDYDKTTVLLSETIDYGQPASPPAIPEHQGMTFDHWEGDYARVTGNCSIYAVFAGITSRISYVRTPVQLWKGAKDLTGLTKIKDIDSALKCEITRALDGTCTLEFETLAKYITIPVDQVLYFKVGKLWFRAVEYKFEADEGAYFLTISAEHISYRLYDIYTPQLSESSISTEDALKKILTGTNLQAGSVDISGQISLMVNKENTSKRAVMQNLLAETGGEMDYDGFAVNIISHIGSTTRRNLFSEEIITDVSYTHSYDYSAGAEEEESVSYEVELSQNAWIDLGDEVLLNFAPLNITNVETRVIQVTYDWFKRWSLSIVLGSYAETLQDLFEETENNAEELSDQIDDLEDDVEQNNDDIGTVAGDSVTGTGDSEVADIGDIGTIGDVGSIGDVGDIGDVGSMGDVGTIGDIDSIDSVGDIGGIESTGDIESVGNISNIGTVPGGGGGSSTSVSVDQVLTAGTEIGGISINGTRTPLYAPTPWTIQSVSSLPSSGEENVLYLVKGE